MENITIEVYAVSAGTEFDFGTRKYRKTPACWEVRVENTQTLRGSIQRFKTEARAYAGSL